MFRYTIISFLLFVVITIRCSSNKNQSKDSEVLILDTSKLVTSFCFQIQDLKNHSMNLNNDLTDSLEVVIGIIDSMELNEKYQKKINVYSTLAMLKLYDYHLECCQQAFNINEMEKGKAKYIIVNALNQIKYTVKNPEMKASSLFYYSIKDTTKEELFKDIIKSISEKLLVLDKK